MEHTVQLVQQARKIVVFDGTVCTTTMENSATDDLLRSLRTGGRLLLYTNDETMFHLGDYCNADLIVVFGTLNEIRTYSVPIICVDPMNNSESRRATRAHKETYMLGLDPNNWARGVMQNITSSLTSDRQSLARCQDIDVPTEILEDGYGVSEHEAANSHETQLLEVAVDSKSENVENPTPDESGLFSPVPPMKSAISTDTSTGNCDADNTLPIITGNDVNGLDKATSQLKRKRWAVTEISSLKRLGYKWREARAKARATERDIECTQIAPLTRHDTPVMERHVESGEISEAIVNQLLVDLTNNGDYVTSDTERYKTPLEPLRAEMPSFPNLTNEDNYVTSNTERYTIPLKSHRVKTPTVIDLTNENNYTSSEIERDTTVSRQLSSDSPNPGRPLVFDLTNDDMVIDLTE